MTGTERLVTVPLREMWPHEAVDFTPWLADNIDLLGEELDMIFDTPETEVPVERFSADVVAMNDQGEMVLVENFLNPSDHRHIGQLVTYAAGLGADYAVLVAESLRDEHRSALGWLNDITRDGGVGFFGVEVAAWRIADSSPAPQLRVVVEPDNWRRNVHSTSDSSGLKALYAAFWAGFLPLVHEAEPRWRGTKTPQPRNWMQFKSALPSVKYVIRVRKSRLVVQAYIDTGDSETTSELYGWLHDQRSDIEVAFGAELAWHRLEPKQASVVNANYPDDVNIEDRDTWPDMWEWLVPTMARLADALDPVLAGY
ncbi:MAG: DUF4268 domain-containing protein [Gammaproteobacteria bacterium]|nr:DUF4268 domain-containing protein [Gammaproteobacteria bacterium]